MLEIMKQRRKELGLTLEEIAKRIGVTRETVGAIERERSKGCNCTIAHIAEVLGLSMYDIRYAQETGCTLIATKPASNEAIKRVFTPGKLYVIRKKHRGGSHTPEDEADWGVKKKLLFVGTAGVHHMFRSPRGGWRTCYTDAQLVGVEVEKGSRP